MHNEENFKLHFFWQMKDAVVANELFDFDLIDLRDVCETEIFRQCIHRHSKFNCFRDFCESSVLQSFFK